MGKLKLSVEKKNTRKGELAKAVVSRAGSARA